MLLTTNFIKLVAYSTPCKEDDKVADVITPILDLAYFIIIIWGSVKVFSKLNQKILTAIYTSIAVHEIALS